MDTGGDGHGGEATGASAPPLAALLNVLTAGINDLALAVDNAGSARALADILLTGTDPAAVLPHVTRLGAWACGLDSLVSVVFAGTQ